MVILDTCAIIWFLFEPQKLSLKAVETIKIAKKNKEINICEISLWEIAMLLKKKRIELECDFSEFIQLLINAGEISFIGINPLVAESIVNLPEVINSDPAYQIIAATAHSLNLPLVTADKNLRKSKYIHTIW